MPGLGILLARSNSGLEGNLHTVGPRFPSNERRDLSWRGQTERVNDWYFGRSQHLRSMWFYAPSELRENREFRSALGWEWMQTAARAVKFGADVDDRTHYAEALDLRGRAAVPRLEWLARFLREVVGSRVTGTVVLAVSWIYYRWRGVYGRYTRGVLRLRRSAAT